MKITKEDLGVLVNLGRTLCGDGVELKLSGRAALIHAKQIDHFQDFINRVGTEVAKQQAAEAGEDKDGDVPTDD